MQRKGLKMKKNSIDITISEEEVQNLRVRSLSMGSALAMIMSWSLHKHIGWAMLHGFFGWFYVLFYWLSSQ